MKKRTGLAPLIAIAVILLGLSVGSFFLTPDRAFSENENRYLQLTPKLSWDTVMSGDFMEDMEEYTSDQIVFRDLWTATRSLLQRAEGKEDISGTYLEKRRVYPGVLRRQRQELPRPDRAQPRGCAAGYAAGERALLRRGGGV